MSPSTQPRSGTHDDLSISGHVPAPIVAPDIEMMADTKHAPLTPLDEKNTIEAIEDVKDATFEDPNSPEAILHRYPLLRDMSEAERDQLNHRVRRRM